jgi:hypothetical protein
VGTVTRSSTTGRVAHLLAGVEAGHVFGERLPQRERLGAVGEDDVVVEERVGVADLDVIAALKFVPDMRFNAKQRYEHGSIRRSRLDSVGDPSLVVCVGVERQIARELTQERLGIVRREAQVGVARWP